MEIESQVARGLKMVSQGARRRLLSEERERIQRRATCDPAMPAPLRWFIEAIFRVISEDIVRSIELDIDGDHAADDAANGGRGEEEAAAVARGTLQVLAVEARSLAPAHGIGTNPYVVGLLGQEVRRSWTAWSNLNPDWNFLMEFPVVSLSGSLELEVLSRSPLFGSDTRLGYVSLPVRDITSGGQKGACLAYRREQLQGATQGEIVLILDYKPHDRDPGQGPTGLARRASCRLWRAAARFRAFFLYHYWPCDKTVFQMYLKEPMDILLLLVSLSPFVAVRAAFYTVLLLCLCVPWPADEHQMVHFLLAFKGTAVLSDGCGRVLYGFLAYYSCVRTGTCASCGAPGSGVGAFSILCDLYQEVLMWFVCFVLLPRSVPYRMRSGVRGGAADADTDASRGGRMRSLLLYNLVCFASSCGIFLMLSARDLVFPSGPEDAWRCRVSENFFWARTVFGLSMFPFLFLLHPKIDKLLTHSTPTGFTRLGTLQRYSPRLRPRRRQCQEGPRQGAAEGGLTQEEAAEAAEAASERADDPVEELKSAIRWFPGGSLALLAGGVGLRAAGAAASVAGAVVSAEVRIANTAVSVGLRAVDVGVCGAQRAAKTPVGEAALACSERLVRRLPGGGHALDTTRQALVAVGFLAADAETQGIAAAEKLLREASGQAENLKLEAASRLAEMLTRARSLSELEATELMDLVGPELGKVSIALRKRRAGVRAAYQRGCDRAFALGQSLLALSWDLASRLPVVGGTLLRTFERELGELQAQRAGRMPGLQPMAQAYLQLVCSCAMQAVLELRAGLAAPSGMPHEAGPRAPEAGASKHGQAWLLHGGAGDAAGAGAGLGCHDDLAPERSLPSPRRGYARSLSRSHSPGSGLEGSPSLRRRGGCPAGSPERTR